MKILGIVLTLLGMAIPSILFNIVVSEVGDIPVFYFIRFMLFVQVFWFSGIFFISGIFLMTRKK